MGFFKTPKAPAAPDPYAVAGAQAGANVQTAVANSWLGNANERGPLGDLDYKATGSHKVSDGKGGTINVPTFTRTTTLSPNQQKLLTGQEKLGMNMNDIAGRQLHSLDKTLSKGVNFDDIDPAPKAPTLRETSGNDYSADRMRVEEAMFSRLRPEMDRTRAAQEARLAAQGITLGSEAQRSSYDDLARGENDARTSVILAGGQEQSRMKGEERADIATDNHARTGMYEMGQNARERAIQERLLPRNQAINEIGALASGGQVSMPQFTQYRGGEVAPTPLAQSVYQSAGLNQDAWNTRAQAAASDRAGLYNLAGDVAGGFMRYGNPFGR